MQASRPIPGPFGFCFSGSERAFCGALEVAVRSFANSRRQRIQQSGNDTIFPTFRYVEIGLGHGETLASAAQYFESLIGYIHGFHTFTCYAVDLPEASDRQSIAERRLAQRGVPASRVEFWLSGATRFFETFPERADCIFIDGCHGAACVTADFLGAERIINPGGIVIFHDTDVYSQGLHPQPHCGTGIDARKAVALLGLLHDHRPGWTYLGETPGDPARGGHGCLFVQKSP